MSATKTRSPPAVERALSILELLAESRNGLTLHDIRERLELPKSSLHCLLVALERRGYLHRNQRTGRYKFGLRLFTLANTALRGLDLREVALPHLRSLMQRTGLTVHMAILEDDEAVLVEKVEPPGTSRLATWIGKRMDLHCTSIGKALAAHLSEESLRRIITERGLPRHNENTIVDPRKLRAELAEVRRQGYAIDDEEDEIGLRCLGTPLLGGDGEPMAAISVAGTADQIVAENERPLASLLKETAAQISEQLRLRALADAGETGVQ